MLFLWGYIFQKWLICGIFWCGASRPQVFIGRQPNMVVDKYHAFYRAPLGHAQKNLPCG